MAERNRTQEEGGEIFGLCGEKDLKRTAEQQHASFDDYRKNMEERLATAEQKYMEVSEMRKKIEEELRLTRKELHDLSTSFATLHDWCAEKRRRCDQVYAGQAPEAASRKRKYIDVSRSCEGKKCSLCKEACTPSGDHTLCSLSCCNFFGKPCITQLIKNKTDGNRSSKCPKCSRKALLKDIRDHDITDMDGDQKETVE